MMNLVGFGVTIRPKTISSFVLIDGFFKGVHFFGVLLNWKKSIQIALLLTVSFLLQGCNYNYYLGQQFEAEERYEAANLEYQRAFTSNPNPTFEASYRRTASLVVEEMFDRYQRLLLQNDYQAAFLLLQRARDLEPQHPKILAEQRHWLKILIAGQLSLEYQSLQNIVPLAGQMQLVVRLNTAYTQHQLKAYVNQENGIFFVEDYLYRAPQDLLMFYTLHSVGFELNQFLDVQQSVVSQEFFNLLRFQTPVLVRSDGELKTQPQPEFFIANGYPSVIIQDNLEPSFWQPPTEIRYSLNLAEEQIVVDSSSNRLDFLPQFLFFNQNEQRALLDFGQLEVRHLEDEAAWGIRRIAGDPTKHLHQLAKSTLYTLYFYSTEKGYPFVQKSENG